MFTWRSWWRLQLSLLGHVLTSYPCLDPKIYRGACAPPRKLLQLLRGRLLGRLTASVYEIVSISKIDRKICGMMELDLISFFVFFSARCEIRCIFKKVKIFFDNKCPLLISKVSTPRSDLRIFSKWFMSRHLVRRY